MKTHYIGIDGNSGIERKREKGKGKGEILEEKAKIKEYLSRQFGNLVQYKLPQIYTYVKVIKMILQNNIGIRDPNGHLWLPNGTSCTQIVLNLIELLAKKIP